LAEDKQITYHAPGKFDPSTGKLNPPNKFQKMKYQDVFGKTLLHLAQLNPKIVAITPAMPTGSGLVELMEAFPHRCIDVGIAEQHAVTLASGMATQGILPFCVVYSTFLQRAYDQVIHDVALQNLPVVFCIDRAGIVGHDGPTHHGVFDIAYLRCVPNLTICTPRNAEQLQNALFTAQLGLNFPLAIRYPRGYSEFEQLNFDFKKIKWGKGECLKEGSQYAILSFGTLSNTIALALEKITDKESFSHYDMRFVKPLDHNLLHHIFQKYQYLLVYEEGSIKGGAGAAVLEFASAHQYNTPIGLEGIPDRFISHGSTEKLLEQLGFDVDGICKRLTSILTKFKE
jgi:1-deoxy-D-xylulose-5-phosphate synthase